MRRDEAYLLDMLMAAKRAIRHVASLTRDEFENSELYQDATIRSLEIIGEASRRVSSEFCVNHPEIPWREIAGMRNRITHEYFRENLAAIWDTVQNDLPRLIEQIEPLIPQEDEL